MKALLQQAEITLTVAGDYSALGWKLFPCHGATQSGCTCGFKDCEHPGKHPATRRGFKDATTDLAQLNTWWMKLPAANLAIATGALSGLVVLDVDPRHGGDESLADLQRQHGRLPTTVTVLTGGGGQHYYFAHPGSYVKSRELRPGLDIKADGGYVIAPPSAHITGGRYVWETGCSPEEVPLAPAPSWLLHELAEPAQQRAPDVPSAISSGSRNSALASLAGTLRRRGMTEGEISNALLAINAGRCQPPLSEQEVLTIAASVARYQPAQASTILDRRTRAKARAFR